jgi:hypothetical protein
MKLLIYSEEDKFAKLVATALYDLRTEYRMGCFNGFRHVAHERVWTGAIKVAGKCGPTVEYPLQLAAVSVGPDYGDLLKKCGVGWDQVVRLQTWKPNSATPRPKRLMCFVPGSPITVLLKDAGSFWSQAETERQQNKMQADARRVALQLVDTMLVRHKEWLDSRPKKPATPIPAFRRRHSRLPCLYFSGL